MSRIILSRYPDGAEKVVVGWDHPCGGAFWQEWAPLKVEEFVVREGGFVQGIPLPVFKQDVPEDLRPLVTDEVMALLAAHAEDPDSGYNKGPIDLSQS